MPTVGQLRVLIWKPYIHSSTIMNKKESKRRLAPRALGTLVIVLLLPVIIPLVVVILIACLLVTLYYVAWVWLICVPTRGYFACRLPAPKTVFINPRMPIWPQKLSTK
jgi:hypothetical protein